MWLSPLGGETAAAERRGGDEDDDEDDDAAAGARLVDGAFTCLAPRLSDRTVLVTPFRSFQPASALLFFFFRAPIAAGDATCVQWAAEVNKHVVRSMAARLPLRAVADRQGGRRREGDGGERRRR